jgi:hypothetical protein
MITTVPSFGVLKRFYFKTYGETLRRSRPDSAEEREFGDCFAEDPQTRCVVTRFIDLDEVAAEHSKRRWI